MFDTNNQINDLIAAADTPSIGSKPSNQMIDDAMDHAMGRINKGSRSIANSGSRSTIGPGRIKTIGSFEGYRNSASTVLSPNGTGYNNPRYHGKRYARQALISQGTTKGALRNFTAKKGTISLTNMIMKSNIENSSVTKLAAKTAMNRVF